MNGSIETEKAALMARASTRTLVAAALRLEAVPARGQHEQRVLMWTYAEIERRFPAAVEQMEATFFAEEVVEQTGASTLTYGEMLLASLPSGAMR